MGSDLDVIGVHVLCLRPIASVVLMLGSPASTPMSPVGADGPSADAPLRASPAPAPAGLPVHGVAPLRFQTPPPVSAAPQDVAAPLRAPPLTPPLTPTPPVTTPLSTESRDAPATWSKLAAPLGSGPTRTPERTDPRTLRAIRLELLIGPMWRIRPAETMFLASVEAGRLQGFSGIFHVGVIVAPDRDAIAAIDLPIGAGFVARRRFGERPLYGSVGLTAGLLVHRAATERGVIHRVDPDFQLPLRFAWTAGPVGLSIALLQGFSVRPRTYSRRGVEVWSRIPYRIGFAVGIHFAIGDRRTTPRRSTAGPRGSP